MTERRRPAAEALVPDRPPELAEWLVVMAVVLLPLEQALPTVGGVSAIVVLLGLAGLSCLAAEPAVLARSVTRPVFLAGYALVLVGLISETFRLVPGNEYAFRTLQFVTGAAIVAAVVRSPRQFGLFRASLTAMGTWLAVYLLLTKYSVIAGAQVTGFSDASRLRADTFEGASLDNNVNALSFLAAVGAVTTLAWAVEAAGQDRSWMLSGLAAMQFLACTLALSRDGVALAVVGAACVLFRSQGRRIRRIGVAALLGLVTFLLVPGAALARFQLDPVSADGKRDARSVIWQASIDHWHEYVWTGVGENAFKTWWGASRGFSREGLILGAHNAYLQVTIYWGVLGLAALLLMILMLWRERARIVGVLDSPAATIATAWVVLVTLRLAFTHTLYDKSIAVLVGGVVGLSSMAARDRVASASVSADVSQRTMS